MKKKLLTVIICLLVLISAGGAYLYNAKKQEEIRIEQERILEEQRLAEEERIKQEKELQLKKDNALNEAGINFDEKLYQIAKDNNVIGMSIAIFKDNKILHTVNYGYADRENKIETNDNTKYRIASISKLITTIGLMRLYDQGEFELDDYISDVTGIDYDSIYGKVTFKDLLTHTAGINSYSYAYERACNGERLSLDYVLKNSHYAYEVGSHYEYSNLGLSSVGGIIEKITGEYFGDYMRTFFESLDIDAAYSRDLIKDTNNIAKLYSGSTSYDVQNWFKVSDWYKTYGLGNSYLQGDGDLIISASDLAKLGMIVAGDGTYDNQQVLNNKTVKLMLDDNLDVYEDDMYKYTEGLSCHNFKTLLEGREIHGHTGSAYGVVTALYFDPFDHSGIVILDNGASNIKDKQNRTLVLYDTLKEAYNCYFNEDMKFVYE